MSAARLIVNADDFGLTVGHNRAIVEAHREGILTSASLLAIGAAFDDAVERARAAEGLGIGVHLALLEGRPLLPAGALPGLVDGEARFFLSYVHLLRGLATGRIALAAIAQEWRAQIEKVLASGLTVTHLDSHKHIHMHPQLLEVALRLANEFGLRRMRLARPLHWTAGGRPLALGLLSLWARRRAAQCGVRTPDRLVGLEASGQMVSARVLSALRRPWRGTWELMMHPAYPSDHLERLRREGYRWIAHYQFEGERHALSDPALRQALDERGIRRIHYGEL